MWTRGKKGYGSGLVGGKTRCQNLGWENLTWKKKRLRNRLDEGRSKSYKGPSLCPHSCLSKSRELGGACAPSSLKPIARALRVRWGCQSQPHPAVRGTEACSPLVGLDISKQGPSGEMETVAALQEKNILQCSCVGAGPRKEGFHACCSLWIAEVSGPMGRHILSFISI